MASAEREVCVDKEAFYKTVEEIKAKQKTKDSPITLFVDDEFYNRAKHFLKAKVEDEQALAEVREPTIEPLVLTAHETSTITRKKWKYANDNIVTEDGRKVIPKDQLHTVLCFAHQRVAHRGRQITQTWIQDNYAELNQKIVNVFTNMCKFHAEQKPVTSRVKPVTQPLSGETFGSLLELDLMDFRKCPCSVHSEPHKWAANFIDHHTKFVHVVPLHRKSAEEVLGVFKTYCLTFGYPRKLITDNGKEFKNKEMNQFCDNNGIKLSHGSSRTPTTQGLVERSNRMWKESTRSLLMSTDKKVDHWCERTLESSYTMNISYHSTIKTSPYEAVFGFKAHREKATPLPEACEQYDTETETDQNKTPPAAQTSSESGTKRHETDHERSSERLKKRRKIQESQEKYNQKMVDSSKERRQKFKINDLVSIKIDKVDKSTLHPNLLMAKIVSVDSYSNYVQVVTPFGRIKGAIAPNRLNHCTATNVTFNDNKEISFSAACKEAAIS